MSVVSAYITVQKFFHFLTLLIHFFLFLFICFTDLLLFQIIFLKNSVLFFQISSLSLFTFNFVLELIYFKFMLLNYTPESLDFILIFQVLFHEFGSVILILFKLSNLSLDLLLLILFDSIVVIFLLIIYFFLRKKLVLNLF